MLHAPPPQGRSRSDTYPVNMYRLTSFGAAPDKRYSFDNVLSTDFGGTLMSDGYAAYRSRMLRLRCWAHLRRKLNGVAARVRHEAPVFGPKSALHPNQINSLPAESMNFV